MKRSDVLGQGKRHYPKKRRKDLNTNKMRDLFEWEGPDAIYRSPREVILDRRAGVDEPEDPE